MSDHAEERLKHRYTGHRLPGCEYRRIDDGTIALVSACSKCSWEFVERTDRASTDCLKMVGYIDGYWETCYLPHHHDGPCQIHPTHQLLTQDRAMT